MFKKFLLLSIILIFVFSVSYFSQINSRMDNSDNSVPFVVLKGESAKDVSQKLEELGLIKSVFYFDLYVWQKEWQTKFQAGIHQLSPAMKMKEIATTLVSGGDSGDETTVKIIEGWSIVDIAEYLEDKDMFDKKDFLTAVGSPMVDYRTKSSQLTPKDYSLNYNFLSDKPKYYGLEGYLFPDTYKVFKTASLDDVVNKMLFNFNLKLTEKMRQDIASQEKSIYEIITMASVIEKEVRTTKDMEIVSGIFWNRIENRQPLQSCATLAYILGVDKKQYTIEDTNVDSPYNTYRYQGLPPGPICNPGLQAIKAAIYPKDTDYNYFLSRSSDGQTIFSKIYEEHLKNKAKYLE